MISHHDAHHSVTTSTRGTDHVEIERLVMGDAAVVTVKMRQDGRKNKIEMMH